MMRATWIAVGVLLAVAAALAVAAGAFLSGLDIDGAFLRAPLERALTAGFGVPARLEGELRLRTGHSATVSAAALVLADPAAPAGTPLARATRPSARIDLAALLRQTFALEEVTGERLELSLERRPDGPPNWSPLFSGSGGEAGFSFAGIDKLTIGRVVGTYARPGEVPVEFTISALDGAVPRQNAVAAAGTTVLSGHEIGFDLRSDSLDALLAGGAGIPVRGTLTWSGVRAKVDGRVEENGTRLNTTVDASAEDAGPFLAALGVVARDPGPFAARGQLSFAVGQAAVRDATLRLGKSALAGSASLAWGSRLRATAALAGEQIDLAPFLSPAAGRSGTITPQALVELLDKVATRLDAEVSVTAVEVAGLPVAARDLSLELSCGEQRAEASAAAAVSGTPVNARFTYDARLPRRAVDLRIDSGAASTAALPRGTAPAALTGNAAAVRGQLRGQGTDAAEIVASLQGQLEARNVRWAVARSGQPPLRGRFDSLRLSVEGTRASSLQANGRLDGAACTVKVFGGALPALLAGKRWPVQVTGGCPGEQVRANGRIALGERQGSGELAFELSSDRYGPVARAIGVPPEIARPISAHGELRLDANLARVKFDSLRAGKALAGSGELLYPLGRAAVPRLRLVLRTLDLDQIVARGARRGPAHDDPLDRTVLPRDLPLPDLDFDLHADRIDVGGHRIGHVELAGAVRARNLQPAPFQVRWNGLAAKGKLGADFSGQRPRIQVDAEAIDADLAPLLAEIGTRDVRATAQRVSVQGQAEGERLADLLATATLDASVEGTRFDVSQRWLAEQVSRGKVTARLAVAPGRTTTLDAQGEVDGQAIDFAAAGGELGALVRQGAALPVTLRASVGDLHFNAEGSLSPKGALTGRVRLAGGRLDHLGRLIGLPLPAEGPYTATADVTLSAHAVELSELAVKLGHSDVAGHLRLALRDGDRPRHHVKLQSAALHLEDIGAEYWLQAIDAIRGDPSAPTTRAAWPIEWGLALLREADLDAKLDIAALFGGGEPFATGRLLAAAEAGKLRVQLQEVRARDARIDAELDVDATDALPRYGLRANLHDVEYGPLMRAMDPDTPTSGYVEVIADLKAFGAPGALASSAAGTLDLAVYPHGLQSRALNLWGAGLLRGVMSQVDPNATSVIECSVAGFDIVDGIARSNGFFIDTTRARLLGTIEINLATRAVSGRIDARSNEPRLLQIAPTMVLGGTLESPLLTGAPENILLVPLRLATPMLQFATEWLSDRGALAESRRGCGEAFARVRRLHEEGSRAAPR